MKKLTYTKLKEEVCKANKWLFDQGLVILTWGNVSAIDREKKIIAIKPSGVDYDQLTAEDIVILNLNGDIIEGNKRPSTDTATHIEIYKHFPNVGSIVHTHSTYATAFAQAKKEIECLGTTHADHFFGNIPLTRTLTKEEMTDYEKNTGLIIIELFKKKDFDPQKMQACLIPNHAPFIWGKTIKDALYNTRVLEEVARMNVLTYNLTNKPEIPDYLLKKHYERKYGEKAYYGQKQ